jgi:magnesium chelatase subunit I
VQTLPTTLGGLKNSSYSEERISFRTVKDELRQNLICRLQRREPLFPGVVGYDDTVIPQISNAILSRHNFILLGLRGQAKTRIIRLLTTLLDPRTPYIAGCEIRDNPYRPICRRCRDLVAEQGEATPIGWLTPDERYVEKLATPDVTIADMIGDIDPIKAARRGEDISSELTVHYGLLPRANARGKIITPLKDRIGSEIRTHYPATVDEGIEITAQESWTERATPLELRVPKYIRQIIEQIAFLAREDKRVDKRSGVSQRLPISVLENVVSNAERRGLRAGETDAVPRVCDIYSALPAITGKLELEYEGELKGGDTIARELIRTAVGKVFNSYFDDVNMSSIVQWFDLGGSVRLDEAVRSEEMVRQLSAIQGLLEKTGRLGLGSNEPDATRASAAEFVLEGLYAHRRISRSEEHGFIRDERKREQAGEEPKRQSARRQFN